MPQFTAEHGVHVHYEVADAGEHPRAVIQLVHGVGEHIGRYSELIDALTASGYSVWANDQLGHGRTGEQQYGGDLRRIGRLGRGGLRAAVAIVRQFSGIVRAANPELPLVLLGHSWGSLMAQMIINRHPRDYDAVVLSGTAYRTPFHMDGGRLNRRHAHLGPTPVEWLSRDPEVRQAFMADPYTTATPLQKLFGIRNAIRLLGRPAKGLPSGLPLLILAGSDDTLAGEPSVAALARAYVERSGLTDVEAIVYPGARHEVFNETNRAEVRADLIGWLDERFAPRGAA